MDFALTTLPKLASILSIKFIDVADIVSIPEPDADNNIDLSLITLASGKEWHTMQAIPNTGMLSIENIDSEQGSYEMPNIKLKLNDATMQELNKLSQLRLGRYLTIPTDGSGNQYLCGSLEQWLDIKYKLDVAASRANIQIIDIEFYFR
jgi:hypothetical protein